MLSIISIDDEGFVLVPVRDTDSEEATPNTV